MLSLNVIGGQITLLRNFEIKWNLNIKAKRSLLVTKILNSESCKPMHNIQHFYKFPNSCEYSYEVICIYIYLGMPRNYSDANILSQTDLSSSDCLNYLQKLARLWVMPLCLIDGS